MMMMRYGERFKEDVTRLNWSDVDVEALGAPSILLVEDDDDCRALLVTLLELAWMEVTPCRTAEEGLEQLREAPFDLVLTDYCLPHRTGGWLLQQAHNEGLLESTPAIVVTAHPNPPDVDPFEIVFKPFDLDDLVGRVRRRLDVPREAQSRRRAGARSVRGDGHGGEHDSRPDPIEAVLYVSGESPESALAIDRIRSVLSRFNSSHVTLTVRDLNKVPTDEHRGAFPAASALRGPRTLILGHLTNPQLLLELLEDCDAP